jgi:hypothetical protein
VIDFPPVVLAPPYPQPTPDDPDIDRPTTEMLRQLNAAREAERARQLLEREGKRRGKSR